MDRVIDARDVTHEYPDGTRALADVTLSIDRGERLAIVGANGSGKSTLQLVLGGLIEPTAGTVRYFDETTDADAVRDRLGVLLQDPDDYLFNTTVREDIEYGPSQLGRPREAAEHHIEALAATLGLEHQLDRPPFRLSGGEKQRAALASALSFEPDVLLLDEPLGAVDAHFRERILGLLDDHDGTLVVFTPSLEIVPQVAERVVLVGTDGSIAADGCVRDVLTDQSLLESQRLRPPPAVQLLDGIVERDHVPLTVPEARRYLCGDES